MQSERMMPNAVGVSMLGSVSSAGQIELRRTRLDTLHRRLMGLVDDLGCKLQRVEAGVARVAGATPEPGVSPEVAESPAELSGGIGDCVMQAITLGNQIRRLGQLLDALEESI